MRQAFVYSLKIWLTTILLSPLIIFSYRTWHESHNYFDFKEYCWVIVGMTMAFILLLPLMLLIVTVAERFFFKTDHKKLLRVLTLIALTIIYLMLGVIILGQFYRTFKFEDTILFDLTVPFVVGISAWFYNPR